MARKNFSKNNCGQRKESDFYETPFSMTRQLLDVEDFDYWEPVWEPASGNGAMSKILEEKFHVVMTSDLSEGYDFLTETMTTPYIITNPPYRLALEFILQAKKLAEQKIAFLLPVDYLHGVERFEKVFQDKEFPLSKVWNFTRRPMLGDTLRDDGKYRTGMQSYAWFVWDKTHQGSPRLGWINNQKYVLSKNDVDK